MPLPDDYWESYQHRTDSLAKFLEAVRMISAYQSATGSRFVWRGAADASWALESLLARVFREHNGVVPEEEELVALERAILDEARDWALDWHSAGGRLAALELLAGLQHYGIPTRMLDFTFNPLIALWFAVEQKEDVDDETDGRVFAIDILNRLVKRDDAHLSEPWWFDLNSRTTEWMTESWIWRPPPLEPRMVRQEGCFLMGGIPSEERPRNVRVNGG